MANSSFYRRVTGLLIMLVSFLSLAWLASFGAIPRGTPAAIGQVAPSAELLFSKPAPNGSTLIIKRVAIAEAEAVRGIVAPQRSPDFRPFSITLELQSAKGERILLASRLQFETGAPNSGFRVLDIVTDNGVIVIPVAIGGGLYLWRIELRSVAIESWTLLDGWVKVQMARPLAAAKIQVHVKRLEDGRWSLELTDSELGKTPALYEQEGTDWHFKLLHDVQATSGYPAPADLSPTSSSAPANR